MDILISSLLGKGIEAVRGLPSSLVGSDRGVELQQRTSQKYDFEEVLRGLLRPDAENQVNEEELFAAVIYERIKAFHGKELADHYQKTFETNKEKLRRADGHTFVEEAAGDALKELVLSGRLTAEEGDKIYSQAFRAAQLNDNHDELWDSRGGPDDPTIAVEELEAAILSARMIVEQFDDGEKDIDLRPLVERATDSVFHPLPGSVVNQFSAPVTPPSDGQGSSGVPAAGAASGNQVSAAGGRISTHSPNDGPGGFLFKPVSESDGNLVVLLPAAITHKIQSVLLRDSDGNEIERGRMAGIHNEGREHFRFSRPGGRYPGHVTVEVLMKDGSIRHYHINDPSRRHD